MLRHSTGVRWIAPICRSARRRARIERSREQRRAAIRFWVVVLGLLAVTVLLTVTTWREIERLFGL